MIDINERFNVRSTINYYNVRLIKGNIYEAEAKGNYFRLVTDSTHGSLALKAYQQNLYVKYYY